MKRKAPYMITLFGHTVALMVTFAKSGCFHFDGKKERYVDFFAFGCCERHGLDDRTHVLRFVFGPVLVIFGVR